MYRKKEHIHLVGIGGAGMNGIAEVLLNLGYKISGSDLKASETTRRLQSLGAVVNYGHSKNHIQGADVVVVSSAVKPDNPEVVSARQTLIPVISRAEMLAELMRMKYGIAVAGAHGKTTTTSLLATVLSRGGIDPTVVIGGKLNATGANAKMGEGEFLVAEADESDGSFLKLNPTIALITNIDREHLDYYKSLEEIKRIFLEFANKVPFYGLIIICLDDKHLQDLLPKLKKRCTTYGLTSQADLQAKNIKFTGLTTSFTVFYRNDTLGDVTINLPGAHNVLNALGAIAVALELDIDFSLIKEGLKEFSGVDRRFQIKEINDITLVDDYAHHPTEIKATLSAAKNAWDRRVIAIFQPHRYSRTKILFKDFLTAFYQADVLVVANIYPAGENPIAGVSAKRLFEGIREHGHKNTVFIPAKEEMVEWVLENLRPHDVVITLGAGDIWQTGEELLKRLSSEE